MAWLKLRHLVEDGVMPATMLVGHTPPSLAQALIFLVLLGVAVDPVLLVGCMIALLIGGLLGAPLVSWTRVWIVQLVVAIALLIAAVLAVVLYASAVMFRAAFLGRRVAPDAAEPHVPVN